MVFGDCASDSVSFDISVWMVLSSSFWSFSRWNSQSFCEPIFQVMQCGLVGYTSYVCFLFFFVAQLKKIEKLRHSSVSFFILCFTSATEYLFFAPYFAKTENAVACGFFAGALREHILFAQQATRHVTVAFTSFVYCWIVIACVLASPCLAKRKISWWAMNDLALFNTFVVM